MGCAYGRLSGSLVGVHFVTTRCTLDGERGRRSCPVGQVYVPLGLWRTTMRSRTRGSKWSSSLRCGYDDMGNQFGIAHILCIVCVSERCVNKELRCV